MFWNRLDAKSQWPLCKTEPLEHGLVGQLEFARQGGQCVWCNAAPERVFSALCASVSAPLMPEAMLQDTVLDECKLCARADLIGGLSLIARSIFSVAQRFMEAHTRECPKDRKERSAYLQDVCVRQLHEVIFEECFLACYDRNVMNMWKVLVLCRHDTNRATIESIMHMLCKLPSHMHEALALDTSDLVFFIGIQECTPEEQKKFTLACKQSARDMAESIIRTANIKFNF